MRRAYGWLAVLAMTACDTNGESPAEAEDEVLEAGEDGKADGWISGCSATTLAKQSYANLPAGYEASTAAQKQTTLWELLASTEYARTCRPSSGTFLQAVKSTNSIPKLPLTFEHSSDQLPTGRAKMLHPFGAVARFELVTDENAPRYTGLLAPGSKVYGIARFSLAGDAKLIGFTPGMALKFLVDGKPSLNVMAMDSLMGQDRDRNFFRHLFANGVGDPHVGVPFWDLLNWAKADALAFASNTIFAASMAQGPDAPNPNHLRVDHLAAWKPDGKPVPRAERDYPYDLLFEPAPALQRKWDNNFLYRYVSDYRDVLGEIVSPGDVLYTVYGAKRGEPTPRRIGVIRATSRFVASKWGDFRLFFRHNDYQKGAGATQ
jgi:hypothetical protein